METLEIMLSCTRCGETWLRRTLERPKKCPRCTSPYWDKPRRQPSTNPSAVYRRAKRQGNEAQALKALKQIKTARKKAKENNT
jgi:predicted Zn-ribbon and HTH transcriptional regulator